LIGTLEEELFLSIPSLEEIEADFNLGFVYGTDNGTLAYIDRENEINLTAIATLTNEVELEARNIIVF
jgi:hypothetical protein